MLFFFRKGKTLNVLYPFSSISNDILMSVETNSKGDDLRLNFVNTVLI